MKTLQGKFVPQNIHKYRGNYRNIVYRSSWELKFMKYCDLRSNILEWGSEEIAIPYFSPLDKKVHRYFVDFYIKVVDKDGQTKKYLVEIKPKKQTVPPTSSKKTKFYIKEVTEYIKNQAKWDAAKNFCDKNQWEFLILTEVELKI